MKFVLLLILPLVLDITPALPFPLKAKIAINLNRLEDQGYVKHILGALDQANVLLSKVVPILQAPEKPDHDYILRTCFGARYAEGLHQIRKNVDSLISGTINIEKVMFVNPTGHSKATAYYDLPPHNSISFQQAFYERSLYIGALALIHEATHALFGAEDWFRMDGHFTPYGLTNHVEPDPKTHCKGYLVGGDFENFREKAPATSTVQNADSYMLLAHLAFSGVVDITKEISTKLWQMKGVEIPETLKPR